MIIINTKSVYLDVKIYYILYISIIIMFIVEYFPYMFIRNFKQKNFNFNTKKKFIIHKKFVEMCRHQNDTWDISLGTGRLTLKHKPHKPMHGHMAVQ